jgi:hypothetical protein
VGEEEEVLGWVGSSSFSVFLRQLKSCCYWLNLKNVVIG